MDEYIGSLVSMDCGEVLGTYQGQVVSINSAEHTITIVNAFQNGIACLVPRITLNAADIHRLQIVLNAVDAQKASRTVNKHIGLVPRDSGMHGVGSEPAQVSPEMSEIAAALGITNIRQPSLNQNGGQISQQHLRWSPSYTDSSLSSNGESNYSTGVIIPLYPEKLESSPNISMSAKKANKSERAQNGVVMNGMVQNGHVSKNGASNGNGITSENIASNGRSSKNIALNGLSSKNVALNGVSSKNIALNGVSSKNVALNGILSKNVAQNELSLKNTATNDLASKGAVQHGFSTSYVNVNQYMNPQMTVTGLSRPRSANGRKHPNEVGLVIGGNGLKDDNRSKSAGDFNKMCELGGMTSEEWLNSSVKTHPTSFESLRKRTNSASDVNGHKTTNNAHKFSTPRKDKRNQSSRNQTKEDCFAPIDADIDVDFDFESNLALFDKLAVYEEMESDLNMSIPVPCVRTSEQKYRCDENILDGPSAANTVYRQIKFKNNADEVSANGVDGMKCRKEFVTDSGLIVPCVSAETKEKLFSLAEQYGFTTERRSEMIGRSAGEMVLQLLGGSNRFNPKNSHQCPVVVIMCGSGLDALSGINCARQIAGRALSVIVFLPDKSTTIEALNVEMKLFSLTGGLITTDINDLLGSPVDMIVTALGGHEYSIGSTSTWYKNALSWANENKAPVLALDPPLDGGGLTAKWCMSASLPLPFSEKCVQVYLSDLGIPQQVYQEIGIVYRSPFSHKFVIPLYDT